MTFTLAASLLSGAWAESAPRRIVSSNLCADQLVLLLADRDQIVSLSRTVAEPALSNVVALARGIPVNHQRAEEIVALRPDLVISGESREVGINATLTRLGLRVITVPSPQSLAETRAAILALARALGHEDRGAAMIADMDKRLEALTPRDNARPRAIVYQAKGGTIGAKTLGGELITRAGLQNIAGELGVDLWGSVSLEALAAAAPALVIFESDGQAGNSLAQMAQAHPLLRHLTRHGASVELANKYWICPGPWNVDAVAVMTSARQRLVEIQP